MNNISISQLKVNPSKVINEAVDYPVAVENRNKVKAYILGKELYEKIVSYMEDMIDILAAKKANYSKGVDFEKVAKDLNI